MRDSATYYSAASKAQINSDCSDTASCPEKSYRIDF